MPLFDQERCLGLAFPCRRWRSSGGSWGASRRWRRGSRRRGGCGGRLHQPQLRADAITTRTKSRLLLALVSQLAPLLDQIKHYDAEITRLFLSHPDSQLFLSLPRAGKRLAPRLLAGWGDDRERYASAASVQALAGTSPVAYESGNYSRAHRRYACIKPFRNTLYPRLYPIMGNGQGGGHFRTEE